MTTRVLPGRGPTTGARSRSLRARLLWAFLVPLALVLAVVGTAATAAVHGELLGQVDDRLAAAVDRSAHADGAPGDGEAGDGEAGDGEAGDGDGPDFLLVPGQGDGTLGARVVDGAVVEAAVIGTGGEGEALTREQAAVLAGVPADDVARTVDLGPLGDYRVVATATGDGGAIVTGLPLASAETALVRLVAVEAVAGLLGLLAAGAVGSVVVGRTLRPLHRVAATAGRVAELPLSSGEVQLAERVPAAHTDPRTEVGRVGAALNRLLNSVESGIAARQASETRLRRFVADASHELRTPVTSIRGYTELVRRRGGLPEDADASLRRVEAEAVRMSGLVDDLLLLARLDAGRELAVDTVDLTGLVMDAVSDAHAAGPAHSWRVDLPAAAVLAPGDAARLHQVLANLLANVRTHTPPGTTATTRLRAEDGTAVLEVADDGPGLPAGLLPGVFERFARGDASRSRASGSTGLGLAIVAAVVEGHGGTVGVDSRPGRTVFTVRLPGATVAEFEDDDAEEPAPAPA
ncbi:two-component system, OmpR family, sensor kinase [Geodermatophilus amargosae]|uniref:histidine kinase n=1 Tax=Geodermatophilus amargosae TaxID=1296565 RepID=A0A1I6Z251_9ACTN|nr:HAMP domain-containing sensor histidine kinase [Geodermatophilus amargosae]SFT56797.1 two-component system, OmpR family, sensor kinase [Geodermatophilus amargosae]